MALVGIIANPASGKDIRRLVAQATVVDNQAKVGIIQRALIGLEAMGVRRALIMPDTNRLGDQALARFNGRARPRGPLTASAFQAAILDMPWVGDASDSLRAARLLRDQGAACIITLGGDGTVRVVSQGSGDVPLLPISTGTNNVLPTFVEGTVAGMAAGALATGQVAIKAVARRHKWLEVRVGERHDRALVDVALVRGHFIGARAVWRAGDIRQIVVTRANPAAIGISGLVGALQPLEPDKPFGLALVLSKEARSSVWGLIGPGLVVEVGVEAIRPLRIGEELVLHADEPLILALDGEREIPLHPGQEAVLCLRDDGPWLVDPQAALLTLAEQGFFRRDL